MNYGNKLIFLITSIYLFPFFLYAQEGGGSTAPGSGGITFITALPFIDGDNISSLGELVNALFLLALVTGALLAVVKLVIAGATYMLIDVVTKKQSAIASIKGAVLGLLLILSTWLILTQINPDITDSTGINLPVITVPDDEDRDERIIEEMCEDANCKEVACDDGNITQCENKCEEAGETYGEENTHFSEEGTCVIKLPSDEEIEENCDASGGMYIPRSYTYPVREPYCQETDDTNNTTTVSTQSEFIESVNDIENYTSLVLLDDGLYNSELTDDFIEDLTEQCRNIYFGNNVEFYEIEDEDRVGVACFGGNI